MQRSHPFPFLGQKAYLLQGYNTAQAKAALPKFMPTPDREKVDFLVRVEPNTPKSA